MCRLPGVLGSENDVLDAILGGSTSIDISRISAFALTSYGCNKSKLLSIPFTFEKPRTLLELRQQRAGT